MAGAAELGEAIASLNGQILSLAGGLAGFAGIISGLEKGLNLVTKVATNLANAVISTVSAVPIFGEALGIATDGLSKVASATITLVRGAIEAGAGLIALGLAATPGGFKVLGEVVNYLTTVLGSALAPIAVVVIAAIATVADYFMGPMLDAMGVVTEWLGNNLFAATVRLVDIFDTAYVKIANFADYLIIVADFIKLGWQTATYGVLKALDGLNHAIGWIVDKIPFTGKAGKEIMAREDIGKLADKALDEMRGSVSDIDNRRFGIERRNTALEERKANRPEAVAAGMDTFIKNLKSTVQGVNVALAEKGNLGFTGLADIAKVIQRQAFQDDFQARTLNLQARIAKGVERLEQVIEAKKGGLLP